MIFLLIPTILISFCVLGYSAEMDAQNQPPCSAWLAVVLITTVGVVLALR